MEKQRAGLECIAAPPGTSSLTSSVRQTPEPVFVNLLRSPGIDSQSGGPVR